MSTSTLSRTTSCSSSALTGQTPRSSKSSSSSALCSAGPKVSPAAFYLTSPRYSSSESKLTCYLSAPSRRKRTSRPLPPRHHHIRGATTVSPNDHIIPPAFQPPSQLSVSDADEQLCARQSGREQQQGEPCGAVEQLLGAGVGRAGGAGGAESEWYVGGQSAGEFAGAAVGMLLWVIAM